MSNIDELGHLVWRLHGLLGSPHPGFLTWNDAVARFLRSIDDFHPDGPRAAAELKAARAVRDAFLTELAGGERRGIWSDDVLRAIIEKAKRET